MTHLRRPASLPRLLRSTTAEPPCRFQRDYLQTLTYPNEYWGPAEPSSALQSNGSTGMSRLDTRRLVTSTRRRRVPHLLHKLGDATHSQLLTRGVSHVSHPLFRKAQTEQPPPPPPAPPPSLPAVLCVRTAQPAASCCCTTAGGGKQRWGCCGTVSTLTAHRSPQLLSKSVTDAATGPKIRLVSIPVPLQPSPATT